MKSCYVTPVLLKAGSRIACIAPEDLLNGASLLMTRDPVTRRNQSG